jgi:hypothetical protein
VFSAKAAMPGDYPGIPIHFFTSTAMGPGYLIPLLWPVFVRPAAISPA